MSDTGINDIPFVRSLKEGRKTAGDNPVFVKSGAKIMLDFLKAEALGLSVLAKQQFVPVPKVYCIGVDESQEVAFLMEDLLDGGSQRNESFAELGRGLANMHLLDASEYVPGGRYGFSEDNFIGLSPQKNTPKDSWVNFFRDERLAPQLEMASEYIDTSLMKKAERLLSKLSDYIPEDPKPSLLHGDLWGGNAICGPDGRAWIIDPAVYVGHSETDIAMTLMFGGFSMDFYDAYNEVITLDEDFYRERRHIYNLYHYLNHLNIFGNSYLPGVKDLISKFS